MTNLAFAAADTLGMTLYQIDGGLEAAEIHDLKLGPWQVPVLIDVVDDLTTRKELTFWVTLNHRLTLYVIVRDKESWVIVLDSVARALITHEDDEHTTLKTRLNELLPAMVAQFYWRDEVWAKEPLDTLWWR